MEFEALERTDSEATGAAVLDVVVGAEDVRRLLAEFYEVVAIHHGLAGDAPWEDVDAAAEKALSAEGYRELRRDYVVNRAAGAALERCGLVPALTPDVHVLAYPEAGSAFGFSLSVVERPRLALSSYGPVEVEMERVEVTDGLVDARIAGFLEAHAVYDEAPPRAVRRGDCVKVDVMTTLEGKAVPRLTGNGMLLELVPGAMPEPFVDGVVGMEVGETKVVDYAVRRPRAIADDDVDRYQATVTVLSQQRKAVPPLTDEWVAAHVEKASSVQELRAGVARGLEAEVEACNRDTLARLANIELEKRLVGSIPDAFYRAARQGLMDKLEADLAAKGQTIDDYYEQEHMNEEELSVQMLVRSGENLRQGFALEALFDGRGMRMTDADRERAWGHAFGRGSYDAEELRRSGKYPLVESAAKRMVALNWLVDTAIVKG